MKLIDIGLRLIISSSAFVALLLFSIPGFGTLLSGLTAFVTLWFSAIVIRWEIVQKVGNTQAEVGTEMHEKGDDKDDDKEDNASPVCCAGVINCLKKRQPHVHAIFVLDIITFAGFIVLNVFIAADPLPY